MLLCFVFCVNVGVEVLFKKILCLEEEECVMLSLLIIRGEKTAFSFFLRFTYLFLLLRAFMFLTVTAAEVVLLFWKALLFCVFLFYFVCLFV